MCVRSPLTGCQSGSHCWDALNLSHLNLSTDGHIVSASSNAHLCCGLKGDCAVYQRAAIFKSRTLSRISVSCQVTTASPSSFPSLSLSRCPSIPPCGKSPAHHMFSEESIQIHRDAGLKKGSRHV